MIVSVVACGESAREWHKVPVDLSIGVNDCFKFGVKTNLLVVVNSPRKFSAEKNHGIDRIKIIKEHQPDKFYCHNRNWAPYYPNLEILPLKTFIGRYARGRVYSSKTSPFVAITLAASLGAHEIILWGVDMVTHHQYRKGTKYFGFEFQQYLSLFRQLADNGVKLYIGNAETVFKDQLPIYTQ